MIRQGDVLLIPTTTNPKNKIAEHEYVIAWGETTGHKHLVKGNLTVFQQMEGPVLIQIHDKAELVHEEHAPHILKKGTYEVRLQREYDVVQGIRQVMD